MINKRAGSAIGLGIVFGLTIGAAFDQVGVGLALGICFGAAFESRRRQDPDDH